MENHLEIEENIADLNKSQNDCLTILNELLDTKDAEGRILVFEIDSQLKNEPIFCSRINKNVPTFLFDFIENIFENVYKDCGDFIRQVVSKIKNIENSISIHIEKPHLFFRKFLKKWIQNIEINENQISSKRTSKNISNTFDNIQEPTPSESPLVGRSSNVDTSYLIDVDKDSPLINLYNFMVSKEDPNGISYMKIFYRLPHHGTHKLFYQIIGNPISFSLIKRKIVKGQYLTVEEIYQDFKIMLTNALSYFFKDSDIYTIAQFLLSELESFANDHNIKNFDIKLNNLSTYQKEDSIMNKVNKKPHSMKIKHVFRKLLKLKAKDESRLVCNDFLKLPPIELYPDYYKIITNPIDLKMIEAKIKSKKYNNVKDMAVDLALLVSNARFYNKTTSQIYRDTFEIEKFINHNITSKIKKLLQETIKNREYLTAPSSLVKKEISQLYLAVHSATDNKNIKLFRVAGLQKQIKLLKTTIYAQTDPIEFFSLIFDILKKNAEKSRNLSKSYNSSLILMTLLVNKFNKIYPESEISFHLKIENIIDTIFNALKTLKDPYGVTCWNSLSNSICSEEFSLDNQTFSRTITSRDIEYCVGKQHYMKLGIFMNDLITLLRSVKERYPSHLEPHVHSSIIFESVISMISHLDKNKYIYEEYINWVQFFNDIKYQHKISEIVGIPAVCKEIIEIADNFTEEPINFSHIKMFNHAKFREVIYNSGDFVTVSFKNIQKIVMIRKFFMLPSGKKAFISHLVSNSKSLLLGYAREFADNELVLLNKFCCYRVKDIGNKINIAQIYKSYSVNPSESPEFFIYSIYDQKYMSLYNIPIETDKINIDFTIPQRSMIVSPPIEVQFDNFIPNMLVHYYSRFHHFQSHEKSTKPRDYFVYKRILIRKGDFIQTIFDEKSKLYQIHDLKYSEFDETSLIDEIQLICREYIHYNELKNFIHNLYYPQEYIQTETIKTIKIKDIQAIVCMMPEYKYLTIRYSQFHEEEVHVCRWKILNNQIYAADSFELESSLKEEIAILKPFNIQKRFPNEFIKEISRVKNSLNESISEKGDHSKISTKRSHDLLWVCRWQECGHTFNSFSLLFYHFKKTHKDFKRLSTNILGNNYKCLWKDCEQNEIEHFKKRVNLIRHVREDHCKNAYISLNNTKDVKIISNLKESTVNQTLVPNMMKNNVILLRDPFIDSLIQFLEKTGQKFEMCQLDTTPIFESIPESLTNKEDNSRQIIPETHEICLIPGEMDYNKEETLVDSTISIS